MQRDSGSTGASVVSARYTIEKHGTSRFFAVRDGGELVVVTAYRKGAEAIVKRLKMADIRIAQQETDLETSSVERDRWGGRS